MRWLGVAGVGLVVAAGVVLGGPAEAQPSGGVRVMALGDSITDGSDVPGGYRINLWQHLAARGYTVDFVGSQSNGPSELGDRDHEGHPGWRIDELEPHVEGWIRRANPRTILLHIGTNDMNQGYDLANAPARLSSLIDTIRGYAPLVELFVAQLTPEANPVWEERIRAFNAAIPAVVAQKGLRTHLVDMHSALTTADLGDGVHPNRAGYDKMAARWFDALRAVPRSLTPVLVPPVGAAAVLSNPQSTRCVDVAGASTSPGSGVIIWDCHTGVNQRWTRTTASELRVYGDRCLDGAKIQACDGSARQKFRFYTDGTIVSVGNGKCLEAASNGTGNGTAVQLSDCNGSGGQRWSAR